MLHRAGAFAQVKLGRKGTGNIVLGALHRFSEGKSLGKIGRNGRGKRIRTHNTDLKNRLKAYSRRYPAICKLTDEDGETGCMEFEIEKGRFSFRLTAPYSDQRRKAASEAAKAHSSNLSHHVQKGVL